MVCMSALPGRSVKLDWMRHGNRNCTRVVNTNVVLRYGFIYSIRAERDLATTESKSGIVLTAPFVLAAAELVSCAGAYRRLAADIARTGLEFGRIRPIDPTSPWAGRPRLLAGVAFLRGRSSETGAFTVKSPPTTLTPG